MTYSRHIFPVLARFCLLIALLHPFQVLAQEIQPPAITPSTDTEVHEEESLAPASIGSIHIQFPIINVGGKRQSALKPGDQFTIYTTDAGTISGATVDLHELGLQSDSPMSSNGSEYYSESMTVPAGVTDGTKTIYISGTSSNGHPIQLQQQVVIDSVPPTGSLTATFTKDSGLSGAWTAHVFGSYSDVNTIAHIVTERTYTMRANGSSEYGGYTSTADAIQNATSTFSYDLPATSPDLDAVAIGYSVTLVDEAGNATEVRSAPFPVFRANAPLIDHAVQGSIIEPSNYTPAGIPAGVGIPYALINGLPTGDYYAVVFFEQGGCPSSNYRINAFIPGNQWGVGQGVPGNPYATAQGTSGGGCMERFHIDSFKGSEWLWGALDPNMASAAIADASGTPAFAICDEKEICDAVTVHGADTSPSPLPGISNVVFLPGIKGSNLYRQKPGCVKEDAACDEKLWLPQSALAVPHVYLDANGRSAEEVYVKDSDLLTEAYGQKFLTSFVDEMNAAATAGTYGAGWQWKPVAYDWRLSPETIVTNGVRRGDRIYYDQASSTPYIEAQVRNFAASSKTGRVTIIAYSNGGLVAKALLQKLGNAETKSLIDKVIFIDVPQTGAARAIGALLFGDREGIPGIPNLPDFIMTSASARTFAHDSPMAYDLLPSLQYLSDTPDPAHPLLSFAGSHFWNIEQRIFGASIDTFSELRSFLEGDEGGRAAPAENDLHTPSILSSTLLTGAQQEHDQLDAWTPPAGLPTYEITGWGDNTISGYQLYEQPKAKLGIPTGEYEPEYRPLFVEDGDGTVPVQSALAVAVSNDVIRYWLNVRGTRYTHGNILESSDLRDLISSLIVGSDDIPADILTAQPAVVDRTKHLMFYLHGTGDLWLCDSNGQCTGHWEGAEYDDVPASFHRSVGVVSYVSVPAGSRYQLHIRGVGSDTDSLDIEERIGDTTIASATLAGFPLSAGSTAALTITDGIADASPLIVDVNNDGNPEFTASPLLDGISFAQPTATATDNTGSDGSGDEGSENNNGDTGDDNSSTGGQDDGDPQGGNRSGYYGSSSSSSHSHQSQRVIVGASSTAQGAAESMNAATETFGTLVEDPARAHTDALHDEPDTAPITTATSTINASNTEPESNLVAAVPEHSFMRLLHALWAFILRIAHAIARLF